MNNFELIVNYVYSLELSTSVILVTIRNNDTQLERSLKLGVDSNEHIFDILGEFGLDTYESCPSVCINDINSLVTYISILVMMRYQSLCSVTTNALIMDGMKVHKIDPVISVKDFANGLQISVTELYYNLKRLDLLRYIDFSNGMNSLIVGYDVIHTIMLKLITNHNKWEGIYNNDYRIFK